jgi:hypothetical protein
MPFLGIVGSNPTLSAPISLHAAADLQGFLLLPLSFPCLILLYLSRVFAIFLLRLSQNLLPDDIDT